MKINIKCSSGKMLPFEADGSVTVARFKEQIASLAEVPAVQQVRYAC